MKPKLLVMPDHGSSGLWIKGGMVEPAAIGLSPALGEELKRWCDYYTDGELQAEPIFDPVAFDARGRALAERVASELGDKFTVEYVS